MNIDNLTFGEIKTLSGFINNNETVKRENIFDDYIGAYVICRTRNEGINAGKVLKADDTGVVLEDARRLWSHEPKDKSLSWYEGVATSGLGSNSRVSSPVTKVIVEDYSLTICTKLAEENIKNAVTNSKD